MTPVFYDTHAHLTFPEFAEEIPALLERAAAAGIRRIITIGTDLESSRRAIALAEAHAEIFAVAGWHPADALAAPEDIRPELIQLASHPKVAALGETGLDYYRLPSTNGGTADDDANLKAKQAQLFTQHLEAAAACGLNVVIHQRGDCLDETLRLFAPFAGRVRGVFHCFVGTPAELARIEAIGSLASFTGIVTFKNGNTVRASAKTARELMLETDCPYLAPVPHRGKRCEPAYVRQIAGTVATVRGVTLDELSRETCAAAHHFFPKLSFC